MTWENIILILSGKSKKVADAYVKAMEPYVVGITKHRQK